MASYELIEADFQQYYNLDVSRLLYGDFRRCLRLMGNLPPTARLMTKISPFKQWQWDDEVKSQILHTLDMISCQISNMGKKKGAKPNKPRKQLQPDYVEKAKKEISKKQKEANSNYAQELADFWEKRNNGNGENMARLTRDQKHSEKQSKPAKNRKRVHGSSTK